MWFGRADRDDITFRLFSVTHGWIAMGFPNLPRISIEALKNPMKFKPSLFRFHSLLCAACAWFVGVSESHSASLLYQWNFNSGDGSNTGSGSGGTLAANVGAGTSTGSFGAAGITGGAGDFALSTSNTYDSWWGSFSGDAANVGTVDLTSVSSSDQFTITMWFKRTGSNGPTLLSIGDTSSPTTASNPGIAISAQPGWQNNGSGVNVNVNGYGTDGGSGDLWGAGAESDWVFLAVAYDGASGIWWNPTMDSLYGHNRNMVILTGDAATSVSVAEGHALNIGDWNTAAGGLGLGGTASIFLGNNGPNTAGFSGFMDDVRIYDGLLTVSEVEGVRLAAIPEPSPALLLGFCGLGLVCRRRR